MKQRTEFIERIHVISKNLGYTEQHWRKYLSIEFGKKRLEELVFCELSHVADHLESVQEREPGQGVL